MGDAIYTCECCHETFPTPEGWSDEQALEVAKKEYGGIPRENLARVCSLCKEKIMDRWNGLSAEEQAKVEGRR